MAIKIEMYEGKWRIAINENFEFENEEEFRKALNEILFMKKYYKRW